MVASAVQGTNASALQISQESFARSPSLVPVGLNSTSTPSSQGRPWEHMSSIPHTPCLWPWLTNKESKVRSAFSFRSVTRSHPERSLCIHARTGVGMEGRGWICDMRKGRKVGNGGPLLWLQGWLSRTPCAGIWEMRWPKEGPDSLQHHGVVDMQGQKQGPGRTLTAAVN